MSHVNDMLDFIRASPSPYHAAAEVVRRLDHAGFEEIPESVPWDSLGDRSYYVVRDGSLVAWSGNLRRAVDGGGFRIIGAHTDSPNLRIKPKPDLQTASVGQLAVEVYGSPLLNSWLDRDLGLSGRVGLRSGATPTIRMFRDDRPLLRIPQLAIHLDREITQVGLKLNPQMHLQPLWTSGPVTDNAFRSYLAEQVDAEANDVVSWDAMVHPVEPGRTIGLDGEFVSSPRIDNLLSCWAATGAIVASRESGSEPNHPVAVVSLFNHEEVGSLSASGASGDLLVRTLSRLVESVESGCDALGRALSRSVFISADGAHATHPNYPDKHDPGHGVLMNSGPVIKHNVNARYATDARGASFFEELCRSVEIPVQHFVSRNDTPCGSTIGPIVAARLGTRTIDVGVAQLAMHSASEMCGSMDPRFFQTALTEFLSSEAGT